jgi:hypothetical protein
MIQDRGVMSQTATGFQPGGRDKHPDAKRSMKIWRSAVAYARTSGVPVSRAKSLGLPIELVCEMKPGELELTALRNGKPAPGVEVTLAVAGKTEPDKVGKTDAAGKVTYKANPTANKALLFIAAVEEAMPKGSNYESNNLTAVLHLNW